MRRHRWTRGSVRGSSSTAPSETGGLAGRSSRFAAISAVSETDLQHRLEQTSLELERLRTENERLRKLLALAQQTQAILAPTIPSPHASAPVGASEKVALMKRLFRGREDVYAVRWENARTKRSSSISADTSRSASTRCLPTTAVGFSRVISMARVGSSTRLRSSTCPASFEYRWRSSEAARAPARTSGSSSPRQSRPRRPAASGHCFCARR
jgi:hypothetical protein